MPPTNAYSGTRPNPIYVVGRLHEIYLERLGLARSGPTAALLVEERFVRTIGIVRAKFKIGMMNLGYNISRLVQLERMAAAHA